MAAPAGFKTFGSWRRQAQIDALVDQLRGWPARARSTGKRIVIDNDALVGADAPLRLAEGWAITAPAPWQVDANGVCQGGQVVASDGSRAIVVEARSPFRSEEHTSELQSLMRISYAVFCLKKKRQESNTNRTVKTER